MRISTRVLGLAAKFGAARHSRRRLAAVLGTLLLLAACVKKAESEKPSTDPEVNATLAQLTKELHHTMVGRKLNRDFDEFVALRRLEVPAPPAGKKYAISEHWKVILVDQ